MRTLLTDVGVLNWTSLDLRVPLLLVLIGLFIISLPVWIQRTLRTGAILAVISLSSLITVRWKIYVFARLPIWVLIWRLNGVSSLCRKWRIERRWTLLLCLQLFSQLTELVELGLDLRHSLFSLISCQTRNNRLVTKSGWLRAVWVNCLQLDFLSLLKSYELAVNLLYLRGWILLGNWSGRNRAYWSGCIGLQELLLVIALNLTERLCGILSVGKRMRSNMPLDRKASVGRSRVVNHHHLLRHSKTSHNLKLIIKMTNFLA